MEGVRGRRQGVGSVGGYFTFRGQGEPCIGGDHLQLAQQQPGTVYNVASEDGVRRVKIHTTHQSCQRQKKCTISTALKT